MKSFETWLTQDLEAVFGLVRNDNIPALKQWLQADYEPSEEQKNNLQKWQNRIYQQVDVLSEADIKVYLILPMIESIGYWTNLYRGFYEYTLSTKKKNIKGEEVVLKGRAEMLVAKGVQLATEPFFFFNEYKPQIPSNKNDPKAQLLSTMLAGQTLNQDELPVFGCYVIGKIWQFVVLQGNEYAVSNSYNAMDEDIFKIFSYLMYIKHYIHKRLNLPFPQ